MTRINKELALEMMLRGESDSTIATEFGTSRQAVNLLRKSFVEKGSLEPRPATRPPVKQEIVPAVPDSRPIQQVAAGQTAPPGAPDFDQITAWMVRVINEAGDAAQLRLQLRQANEQSKAMEQEIRKLATELDNVKSRLAASTTKSDEYHQAVERLQASETNPAAGQRLP